MPFADQGIWGTLSSYGVSPVCYCRVFTLAKERDLDLDFHVDENGNERAKGLLYIARKTIQHGYQCRVVCGHCW